MNISEIFSDSFKYPVSDIRKFAIFGIVVVLATLNVSIANSSVLQIILNVVSFVAIILILGSVMICLILILKQALSMV